MSVLLEAKNVSKTYYSTRGEPVQAVSPVDFSISEGEFISILGPSGCGKTTLLMMMAGLEPRTDGDLTLDGVSIEHPNSKVGLVFQKPVLLPWRTVLENVLLPIQTLKRNRADAMKRASELLSLVGLDGFENKFPHELSGGMQQRNAIVRALVSDPSVLLMDEPFGALDAMTRETMNMELQKIWMENRKTVVLITHSISEALFLSDRVFVMSARPGRIVREIPIPFERPRSFQVMNTQEFNELASDVRELFGAQVSSM